MVKCVADIVVCYCEGRGEWMLGILDVFASIIITLQKQHSRKQQMNSIMLYDGLGIQKRERENG